MTIQKIREEVIKEFIAQELLEENIFPTLELVCAIALRDYKNTEVFASLLNTSINIEKNTPASAAWFNEIVNKTQIDVITLYRFLNFLSTKLTDQKAAIKQKLSSLSSVLKQLHQKVNGLIVLNENANYLTQTFVENFSSYDKIDIDETTALIDIYKKQATVNNNNTVNSKEFNEYIKSIQILCVTPRYIRMAPLVNHQIDKLYDGHDDTLAIYNILMPSDHKGNVDIKIKINLIQPVSFNHVYLKMQEIDTISRFEASAMAIVNTSWKTISDYKAYDSNIEMFFDTITTSDLVINLRLTSSNVSDDGLMYSFFGKELIVDSCDFTGTEVVTTKEFVPNKNFNVVGLNAESEIPQNCNIDYYLAWKTASQWSEFNKIDSGNYLSVLSNEELQKSIHYIDLSYVHPYNSGSNICYSYSSSTKPELNLYKSQIIRNLNNFSIDDEQNQICYFHLDNNKTIDFSLAPGYLDNVYVETSEQVSKGLHKFILKDKNQNTFYTEFFNSNNIKFGSHLASYIEPNEYINIAEDNNYNLFTIKDVLNEANETVFTVIAKQISTNEQIQFLKYAILTPNTATAVKAKAVLTGNGGYTPILKSLKIKVG